MGTESDERVRYLYLILLPDGRGYIGAAADDDRRRVIEPYQFQAREHQRLFGVTMNSHH